jgi:RNA polymerase sigma-70 factor (ECF subfamily)
LNNLQDKERLHAMQQKDKRAFDALFRQYYRLLCLFSYNMIRDKVMAEEIVQEFFVSMWENPPLVSDSVRSYFYKSIYNRTLNHISKANTRLRNEDQYSTQIDQQSEEEAEDKELQNSISKAVDSLPEKCKEIFIMCKYNDMSYSQVSEMLNISPKTVENQMGIALKKLRELLKPLFGKK